MGPRKQPINRHCVRPESHSTVVLIKKSKTCFFGLGAKYLAGLNDHTSESDVAEDPRRSPQWLMDTSAPFGGRVFYI
jgi:hypothetical protein